MSTDEPRPSDATPAVAEHGVGGRGRVGGVDVAASRRRRGRRVPRVAPARPPARAVPADRAAISVSGGSRPRRAGRRGPRRSRPSTSSTTSSSTCSPSPSSPPSTASSPSAARSAGPAACPSPCRGCRWVAGSSTACVAADRVLVGAAVLPWRPARGAYVLVEQVASRCRRARSRSWRSPASPARGAGSAPRRARAPRGHRGPDAHRLLPRRRARRGRRRGWPRRSPTGGPAAGWFRSWLRLSRPSSPARGSATSPDDATVRAGLGRSGDGGDDADHGLHLLDVVVDASGGRSAGPGRSPRRRARRHGLGRRASAGPWGRRLAGSAAPGRAGRSRRAQASVVRARSSRSATSSGARPNGAQPSASSTARRSERPVRPPTQIGTWSCTRSARRQVRTSRSSVPENDDALGGHRGPERAQRLVGPCRPGRRTARRAARTPRPASRRRRRARAGRRDTWSRVP